MNPMPFTQLGRYRVVRELGRGAMGVVYLAQDEALQRDVAVKTLLLPEDAEESRHLEARFRQEAKAAGGLNHPNTVTIYDFGREGNLLFIAMELLQGTDLRERLQAGLLPLDEALDIAGQVASGLAAAHARGVVHRDVKPGNIMVLPGGLAKIMDFGIARMQASEVRTATGTMMGSPRYMSPEQVCGHPADHRSDIFSLGSVLYEMVTGQAAFQGDNLGLLLSAIMHAPPPQATAVRPDLPVPVELVIARAMQKNPAARYQDAAEMARDLVQCRASITRARGAGQTVRPAVVDVGVGSGGPGLPVSADFDASEGMRWLSGGQAPAAPAPAMSWGRTAWACAYLLAGAVALLLAFG